MVTSNEPKEIFFTFIRINQVRTLELKVLLYEEIDVNCFDLIIMDETYKIVDSKNERVSDFIDSRSVRFRKVADIIGRY